MSFKAQTESVTSKNFRSLQSRCELREKWNSSRNKPDVVTHLDRIEQASSSLGKDFSIHVDVPDVPDLVRSSSSCSLSSNSSSSSPVRSSSPRRVIFEKYWSKEKRHYYGCSLNHLTTPNIDPTEKAKNSDEIIRSVENFNKQVDEVNVRETIKSHSSLYLASHDHDNRYLDTLNGHARNISTSSPDARRRRRTIFGSSSISSFVSATKSSEQSSYYYHFGLCPAKTMQLKPVARCKRSKSESSCIRSNEKKTTGADTSNMRRSVSFHPEVQVLEFERVVVEYAAGDGWSKTFI